ncbi:MAG: hypothetical protein ACI4HI_18550 [Lachnospiraceae bacterium]
MSQSYTENLKRKAMSEEKMPYVTLSAEFVVQTDTPANFEVYGAEIGGFEAVIDGKNIPFDFDAFSYDVRKIAENTYHFQYESGNGVMFREYHIFKDFFEEYERLGVQVSELTAERLASMKELTEFHFAPPDDFDGKITGFTITKFAFSDELQEYSVETTAGIFNTAILNILGKNENWVQVIR